MYHVIDYLHICQLFITGKHLNEYVSQLQKPSILANNTLATPKKVFGSNAFIIQ